MRKPEAAKCEQRRGEKGFVLMLTLLFLLFGALIIAPLLGYMGTGIKTGILFQDKIDELYAADAGIERGLSIIMNGQAPSHESPAVTYPAMTVGNKSVVVTIASDWILNGIVPEDRIGPHSTDVVVHGEPSETGVYTITITYDPSTSGDKKVDYLGVWLPTGYDYVLGSCSNSSTRPIGNPHITLMRGGTSLEWNGLNIGLKQTKTPLVVTFRYTPIGKAPKSDVAWCMTQDYDVGLTYDREVYDYIVTSTATDKRTGTHTTVVTHSCVDIGATVAPAIVSYVIQ
jgi:hypothetical protein